MQKAALLAALARATGVPASLGFANLRNNLLPKKVLKQFGTNIIPHHAYTESYLGGKWHPTANKSSPWKRDRVW